MAIQCRANIYLVLLDYGLVRIAGHQFVGEPGPGPTLAHLAGTGLGIWLVGHHAALRQVEPNVRVQVVSTHHLLSQYSKAQRDTNTTLLYTTAPLAGYQRRLRDGGRAGGRDRCCTAPAVQHNKHFILQNGKGKADIWF